MEECLPHLYGMPWYSWAWKFFISANPMNLLCAANQISKSSTQIRKCTDWATNVKKWPSLWPRRPLQFWYLYPTREVATIEFEKKWIPEFLPRGKYKSHPIYGWKPEYKNKFIWAIHFNSGVSVYFKTYATDASHLQSGSCYAIFCDEELPEDLYPELSMRSAATDGYFHMVFTATLGQDFWREAIEVKGRGERFPDAFKQQVSMYDCLKYMDGSSTPWTLEKIEKVKNSCGSEAEVLRRVYGRFIREQGLKYAAFERTKNVKLVSKPYDVPSDWNIYAGVDVGSGGEKGHPAAITFVAVSPDFKRGRVFKGNRMDGIQTTASDVLHKFVELRGPKPITGQFYDWASKDFATIAMRNGHPFVPAEKSHEAGEQILNTLFKNDMLSIDDIPELKPLIHELSTLQRDTPKTKAKDDAADSLRYAVTRIPWDWSAISSQPIQVKQKVLEDRPLRPSRHDVQEVDDQLSMMIENEIESWNELYEA